MAWYSGLLIPKAATSPWSLVAAPDVVNQFRRDESWVYACYVTGTPVVGSSVPGRPRRGTARGTEPKVATNTHPEILWIDINPPVKDENGIPIPTTYLYKTRGMAAEYMVINGRKMRWDGEKYVPMPVVRITTERWRKRGPVDLKIQHGPFLPKARTKAHSLTERIQSLQGPVISLDLSDATPDESVDLLDLLDALNA
jgi:hypothetical protein